MSCGTHIPVFKLLEGAYVAIRHASQSDRLPKGRKYHIRERGGGSIFFFSFNPQFKMASLNSFANYS